MQNEDLPDYKKTFLEEMNYLRQQEEQERQAALTRSNFNETKLEAYVFCKLGLPQKSKITSFPQPNTLLIYGSSTSIKRITKEITTTPTIS